MFVVLILGYSQYKSVSERNHRFDEYIMKQRDEIESLKYRIEYFSRLSGKDIGP